MFKTSKGLFIKKNVNLQHRLYVLEYLLCHNPRITDSDQRLYLDIIKHIKREFRNQKLNCVNTEVDAWHVFGEACLENVGDTVQKKVKKRYCTLLMK